MRERTMGSAGAARMTAMAAAALMALAVGFTSSDAAAQAADQKAPVTPAPSDQGPAPSDKAPIDQAPSASGSGAIPAADLIDADEWREMMSGKTLTYESSAGLIGREYYVPGGDRVIFVYYDGRCFDGHWLHDSGFYCFEYDGFYCFQHFRRDGQIMVREQDGGEQRVTDISDEILSCKPDLLSRAEDAPDFNALTSFVPTRPARREDATNHEG